MRDGVYSVAQLMDMGRQMLGRRHVMEEALDTVDEVQVEGTFPDGTFLVTVHDPICTDNGNLELALYGSFLPVPQWDSLPLPPERTKWDAPGAIIPMPGNIELNAGRERVSLTVKNHGDRPIQVGSHYHFIETNADLEFNRKEAYGMRLDIPAGSAIRFEPGDFKKVTLVQIGGGKRITGGNELATGYVDEIDGPGLELIIQNLEGKGFKHNPDGISLPTAPPYTLDRYFYVDHFGPTTDDLIRLGDTDLWARVERDFTVYGDECKFGGGKVLREGMGQATGKCDEDVLDLVITNAVIIDYTGIIKADIGIKNGYIVGIGKAGNPDVMDGVTTDDDGTPIMIVGASTEVYSGEGKIFTAGAIDTHVHYICPQICPEALAGGITTLIGGGTGPNTGSNATTCTNGKYHVKHMMKATDDLPLNFGFTGKGSSSEIEELREQIQSGCLGLKIHEDWGATPAVINKCLEVCDDEKVQVTIHTDTLNEAGFVESTIAAFKGRTIHTYHSEGAGGGHAPDIISVCGKNNVLPSSTNPTRPFTCNTLDEHLDMLMVAHHLSKDIPEDVAFAESRIRAETIAAEDVLQDIGAISMMSSDGLAMGRIGEVVLRTWKTAHKMKLQHYNRQHKDSKHLEEYKEVKDDNYRIRRYIAKYTINPAIAHGIDHLVGSIEVGKVADLVCYKPAFFGSKPEMVMKSGIIAWSMMGDANGSISTTQPIIFKPMYGAQPSSLSASCFVFVSPSSVDTVKRYGLRKKVEPVQDCRKVCKEHMKLNCAMPEIHVDPETYAVTADDKECVVDPMNTLPMTHSLYLF
ncbi:urea amidohydrolase alpha subunit [Halteromyces radiatus]|uniref:urea amidohydrolase alpha subunit n=1 Tax=Halteromyces radiatus TaxID=101107 RepID=UPI00221E6F5A|nr:urea amidohydrolase alpha subunit [Halteromyces radiatus]KAI8079821.1 urea amidohydrolase alpha subunit [Halteromyces radiatus]